MLKISHYPCATFFFLLRSPPLLKLPFPSASVREPLPDVTHPSCCRPQCKWLCLLYSHSIYTSLLTPFPSRTSCERSLHSCYRTSHSKVSGSLFKNRDKELDQGLKGWTEGLMLSEGVHQMWLTAHHFAVGHTPFAGKDIILMVDKEG